MDKLADIQEATIATASKYIFFFLGLNATVLGFLFSQAILGNLQGLGFWMTIAWGSFGLCFIIDILTAWAVYHSDNLSKMLIIKAHLYSNIISLNRDELSIAHNRPFTKYETIELLKQINDAEFLSAQTEMTDATKKLTDAMQRWYLKYAYHVFVSIQVLVYTLSICIGISLINSRSDILLNEKSQPVAQSSSEISLAPEVLQVLKSLAEKMAAPTSSPAPLPSQAQPSPAHESSPAQTQQSPQQH